MKNLFTTILFAIFFAATVNAETCEIKPKLGLKTKGLSVQFMNKSEGAIKSIEWNFGDGFTSTKADPAHRYSKAGSYSFSLTVTSEEDCVKTFDGKVYVFDVKKKATKEAPKKVVKPTTEKVAAKTTAIAQPKTVNNLTNYPNPFTTSTTLAFELANTSTVEIQVLDITGKLVKVVTNETLTSGQHEVQIDRDNLATGTYLVTVQTNNQVATHKISIQ